MLEKLIAPEKLGDEKLIKSDYFESGEQDSLYDAVYIMENDWTNHSPNDGWIVYESRTVLLENGKYISECVYAIYK